MRDWLWPRLAGILLLGYLVMTQSFAYLGLPTYHVFIGELVLAFFLLMKPEAWLRYWSEALPNRTPLSEFAWALVIFLDYGAFQVLRGAFIGYPLLRTLEEFVFDYYALFIFLGIWAGMCRPKFLPRFVSVLAWCNGLYGLAYLIYLDKLGGHIPGTADVPIFGQPGGSGLAVIGLVTFVRAGVNFWFPLALNSFVMLGMQQRAEWLGLLVGLLVWACLTKRFQKLLPALLVLGGLLWIGYVSHFAMPSPRLRGGGEVSAENIVARGVAPFDYKWAAQHSKLAPMDAATAEWRLKWWQAIWTVVHKEPTRALIGYGYGFILSEFAPTGRNPNLRTPHNALLYALGYTGWIGVLAFLLFQVSIVRLLWRSYKVSGEPFGLGFWAMFVTNACFGGLFESPFGAIPFYTLVGVSAAPLVRRWELGEHLSARHLRGVIRDLHGR